MHKARLHTAKIGLFKSVFLIGMTVQIAYSGASAQPSAQGLPTANLRIEDRTRAISKELRCVVCQNQSIDESNAPLALDLKQLIGEHLTNGKSDEQVKAFLVSRYGNFVLLKPPVQFNTLLLWLGPYLLLAASIWTVLLFFIRARGYSGPKHVELTRGELKRAEALLEKGSDRS
jgi:cytochrome c-type biogenesis protein CcmH